MGLLGLRVAVRVRVLGFFAPRELGFTSRWGGIRGQGTRTSPG